MIKLGLVLLILPLVLTQTCNSQRENGTCSTASGTGVCCYQSSSYSCYLNYTMCCGWDYYCKLGYSCCPAVYPKASWCYKGYVCCGAGKTSMTLCEPGESCCAGGEGACCTYQVKGWVIAVIVIGGVVLLGAIGFFIYKQRQKRMQGFINRGNYQDHMN